MSEQPFRRNDRITVHWGSDKTSKGRVVCHNRRNKYGLSVVILFETMNGYENIETFLPTGKRWAEHDNVFITKGWENT